MIKLTRSTAHHRQMRGLLSMNDRAGRTTRAFLPLRGVSAATRCCCRLPLQMLLILTILVSAFTVAPSQRAIAACPEYCFCEVGNHTAFRANVWIQHAITTAWIALQFVLHREIFWKEWMWRYNIGNALMMWTQEMQRTGMMEVMAVGVWMDAKENLDRQRLLQEKKADAARDYRPDITMCTIGTVARGLGSTWRSAEMVAFGLGENHIDRMLSTRNAGAQSGPAGDKEVRLRKLKSRFCDARDGAGIMGYSLCNPATAVAGRNNDVDFTRTVMEPLTINVNLGDGTATNAEADVFALSNNLYSHTVFPTFPEQFLQSRVGQSYILEQRSVAAKHNVAAYSFNSIVGLKAEGSAASASNAPYLRAVLEQLGIPNTNNESSQILGNRPSYWAIMELLSKKIYQNPEFYVNLYDTPANIERKSAAIQAIRLTQDMDRFNSQLRSEQNLSVLLEMYLEDIQTDAVNTSGGRRE